MTKNTNKKNCLLFASFGIYIILLLWLTLFNREPSSDASGIVLFNSYQNLFSGNIGLLKEILGNIFLFIPAGYFIKTFFKKNCLITLLVGFCISLAIEMIQLITGLGQTDVGDLFNNTLGTLFGYFIYKKFPLTITFNLKNSILWMVTGALAVSITIFSITKISNYINYQHQIFFASMGDTDDKKNLLLMDCKDITTSDGNISLTYQDDGTIHITGTSDDSNWIRLGEATLEPGTYSFTGYSEASWETIAIYLEYNENGEIKYQLISSDSSTTFTLTNTTNVTAHIIAYKNYNCDVIARPVIYKE